MPDRIIRERALTSPSLDLLSDGGERLFWRLVPVADDYGRFDANPMVVRAKCFPLRTEKRLRVSIVETWLKEMVSVDGIRLYSVAGRQYGYFPGWFGSQRRRESRPKFPDPPEGTPSEDLVGPICSTDTEVSASPQLAANGGGSPPIPKAVRPRAEGRESRAVLGGGSPPLPSAPTGIVFTIPEGWLEAIRKAPTFRDVKIFQNPAWWQAELRANRGVDLGAEVEKAQAYLLSHPERSYKNYAQFLHNWFARADRPVA